MTFAENIAVARDIAFLVLMAFTLLAMLVLFFKVSSLLGSAKRTFRNAEDIFSLVSERLVKPAAAGSGMAFGAGKLAGFLLGFGRRRRKGGRNDGE